MAISRSLSYHHYYYSFRKTQPKTVPKNLDSQPNLSQQNINEKDPMPRSSLESTHPVPVTSIVEMPQCLLRHSPSSFALRVAHKRQRERERRALERQDSRNYRPTRRSRPSRAREMNERGVSKLPTSPKESQVGRKLAWVKKRRLLTL